MLLEGGALLTNHCYSHTSGPGVQFLGPLKSVETIALGNYLQYDLGKSKHRVLKENTMRTHTYCIRRSAPVYPPKTGRRICIPICCQPLRTCTAREKVKQALEPPHFTWNKTACPKQTRSLSTKHLNPQFALRYPAHTTGHHLESHWLRHAVLDNRSAIYLHPGHISTLLAPAS